MASALIPIIVTIGISTLVIVASIIGTFFVLLNYMGGRTDQAETRITQAAAKDKSELLDAIRDTERRTTESVRDSEQRLTESIRDSEQRMSRRMDRFEDKTDANFEALRLEPSERASEQPVAGDD